MIDTPAIEKLLGELEALHEKATPGPYDARNDLIRAIRGELAIPLFDVREPYEDKAPTVREPSGSVLFRANTQGARTSQAFRRQHVNAAYALALLENVPTLITTIRALMEAVEWRPIGTAPRDRTPIIICVTCDGREPIVGEAYFNPEAYGGTWWWAGSADGEYADSPIEDINYGAPTLWMPLPQPPAIRSKGEA